MRCLAPQGDYFLEQFLKVLCATTHKPHGLPQQVERKTFVCDTRISHCRKRRSACATSSVFAEVL